MTGGLAISADTQRTGRHRRPDPGLPPPPAEDHRPAGRLRRRRAVIAAAAAVAAVIAIAGVAVAARLGSHPAGRTSAGASAAPRVALPHRPGAYLGVFVHGSPESYAGVTAFAAATGVRPKVVVYYSAWLETFQSGFAATAARHGAVPLVQIDPTGISLAAIASGHYDAYLRSYAAAIRAFGSRVILSFGHEMNGNWYSWGNQHVAPRLFVAAWRHIVTVFRRQGTDNVTWLWTVNIIDRKGGIPSPAPWWPGSAYVTWVGIDGYYAKPSWTFASLFGPTIKAIRALTLDPILISETSATPAAGQPAKIADLFAGIHAYGLLGFVWFDADHAGDWRLTTAAAFAAFRRGALASQRASP
jgi:mannan endo-1,4-beta-mannosidase